MKTKVNLGEINGNKIFFFLYCGKIVDAHSCYKSNANIKQQCPKNGL